MKHILSIYLFLLTSPFLIANGTTIESEKLEMVNEDGRQVFNFTEDVRISGEDLSGTCDELKVYSLKKDPNAKKEVKAATQADSIEKIIATGNVVMQQGEKDGEAQLATIYPQTGKIVLEGNPILRDKTGEVTGHRITFYKNEDKAYVEGKEAEGVRPKVTLTGDMANWDLASTYKKGAKG